MWVNYEFDRLILPPLMLLSLPLVASDPLLLSLPIFPFMLPSSRYQTLLVAYIASRTYPIYAKHFMVVSLLTCCSSFSGSRLTYPNILSFMNNPSFMVSSMLSQPKVLNSSYSLVSMVKYSILIPSSLATSQQQATGSSLAISCSLTMIRYMASMMNCGISLKLSCSCFSKRIILFLPLMVCSILSQRVRTRRSMGSVKSCLSERRAFIDSVRYSRAVGFLCSIRMKQYPKTIRLRMSADAYNTSTLTFDLFLPPLSPFSLASSVAVSPVRELGFRARFLFHFLVSSSSSCLKRGAICSYLGWPLISWLQNILKLRMYWSKLTSICIVSFIADKIYIGGKIKGSDRPQSPFGLPLSFGFKFSEQMRMLSLRLSYSDSSSLRSCSVTAISQLFSSFIALSWATRSERKGMGIFCVIF